MENSERGVHRWLVFATGGVMALGHHVGHVHTLYVAAQGLGTWGAALAFAGVAIAVATSRWFAPRMALPGSRPRALLFAGAAVALVIGGASFASFDHGTAGARVACGSVAVGSFLAAAVAVGLWQSVGRAALALGFVEYSLRPLYLVGLGVSVAALLSLEAQVGCLRSGLFVAVWLAVAGGAYPSVRDFLHGDPRRRATASFVVPSALVLAAGALAIAVDRRLPLAELAHYPDEIVFSTDGEAHRYVVTAAPGGYELFRDGQLSVATLDAPLYARALTRPGLTVAGGGRVVLLDGGSTAIERAITESPRVTELMIVSDDREMGRLTQAIPFLRAPVRAEEARVHVERFVAEPALWLSERTDVWDVLIANLPFPIGYGEGKYYTSHFFRMMRAHVAPHGVAVIPATSAFGARDAFRSIFATLESAGFRVQAYHASIPTLGVASFLIASHGDVTLPGATSLGLGGALDLGQDLARAPGGPIATLHDQYVVNAFGVSRGRRDE